MVAKANTLGKRAGMLVVVNRLPGSKIECKCDCGGRKTLSVGHFNTGKMKSCGCHAPKHGHAGGDRKSREYASYWNMMARCHNPKNKRYLDYGGNGIEVCERWRESFQAFLDDMGKCPKGMQIDRRDNTLGYFPENCRSSTPKENMNNRGCTRIWNVYGEEYLSISDAALDHGVGISTIRAWCLGRMAEGRWYEPKPGCSWRWRYHRNE